ncbi:hypothetical protein LSUE1_G002947 [Lachnellula suecica]|uniref:Uncharacterized protein n=1 Tax=Lachnellula suecica TaxID=602035 RepID=A0A8T9CJB3_9HELO|nr:hypothetical protein LSUE1_G002947 [Lachnellula suecica]
MSSTVLRRLSLIKPYSSYALSTPMFTSILHPLPTALRIFPDVTSVSLPSFCGILRLLCNRHQYIAFSKL